MKKLTRVKAIRQKCLDCGDGYSDIKTCKHTDCQLYPYRLGRRPKCDTTPDKAIKAYCRWCNNTKRGEVTDCGDTICALHDHAPWETGNSLITDECATIPV